MFLFQSQLAIGCLFVTPRTTEAAAAAFLARASPRRRIRVAVTAAVAVAAPSTDESVNDDDSAVSTLWSVQFSNLSSSSGSSGSSHQEDETTTTPQLLCDFLMELGACSTSITDADKDTPMEQAVYGEPPPDDNDDDDNNHHQFWKRSHVTALFSASTNLEFVCNMVQETFVSLSSSSSSSSLLLPPHHNTNNTNTATANNNNNNHSSLWSCCTVTPVPNRDWVTHVQQSWKPIRASPGLVLRFPWHTDDDVWNVVHYDDDNTTSGIDTTTNTLQLQGGVAFGTGEHPTTRLCLQWIERLVQQHQHDNTNCTEEIVNFMDYGAGSGVLGLAACTFNDQIMAVGVDIDADAVRIANVNAETNALSMFNFLPPLRETDDSESKSILMKALLKNTNDVEVLPEESNAPIYDALVANILAGPLVSLVPTLASLVRPGGYLGLSGILTTQANMIVEAYSDLFDNVTVQDELGGWVLITGTRKE